MALHEVERMLIEDAIHEAQLAAEKYLQTGNNTHAKMLKYNVEQCMEIMEEYKQNLVNDEEKDKYKLHLLVPFQINELIKMRSVENDT